MRIFFNRVALFMFIVSGLFAVSDHTTKESTLIALLITMIISIYLYFNTKKQ